MTSAAALRWTRSSLLVAACTLVGGLAGLAVAHIVAFDSARPLLMANALSYWIYIPAYVVLAVAIATRRSRLIAAAAVVVIWHVALVLPSLHGAAALPPGARQWPRLRVFSANVLFDNAQTTGIIHEIEASRADVVLLQEFSRHWERALRHSRVWAEYPYRVVDRPSDLTGLVIMSRLPLRDTKALVLDKSSLAEATVTVGTRSIRIFGVHPNAPAFDFDRWQHYADDTTHLVRRVHGAVIVAGDFNVTQFNKWIGDLEGLGLRSAHEELGHGTDTTWPNGLRPFPPIRLDHVLVSNAVVPLQIREGAGDGSDHKPVIVDLAVKR